ncbi:putative extracellular conserved serine-rich protein [Diaporthe ampelina]|uniref:Putative extracellular conserved serine-rich protein n=1 Tax=Diaporthe ampelina TaxID=1214573 RepID=A0A0G2FJK6_9PEZI|nr:putative extracellular conserved serine-rich protein [Diaporthe ampelina]
MFSKSLFTLSSLLAASSAITITEPQQGAKLDFSGSNTISWTSVDTDPVSFEIVLVSPNNSTIAQSVITNSVNTTENEYTFSNIVTPVGDNYQVNFIGNVGTNKGIISQSQTFAVTKSGVALTTTSAAGSTATGTGASASASSSDTSAASAFGVTFGIAGPIVAALSILL